MKKSFLKTYIIGFIGILTCYMLLNNVSGLSTKACYAITVILYLAVVLPNIVHQYKIPKILNDDCDPHKYLEELKKIENYKNSTVYKNYYALNYSAGLIYKGEHSEALHRMKDVDVSTLLLSKQKSIYYSNLLSIFFSDNISDREKEQCNKLYSTKTSTEFFASNEYNLMLDELMSSDTSDEALNLLIEKASTIFSTNKNKLPMINKVLLKHTMGIIYFELGDMENAKKNFNYTIKNGNKLYIVELSRQYLERINAL